MITLLVVLGVLVVGGGVAYAAKRFAKPATLPVGGTPTFSDSFNKGSLDTALWFAQHGDAPGNKPGVNYGSFQPDQVDLSQGMLRLAVSQTINGKVISRDGEVISNQLFGYGIYTFVMRMASTAATHDAPGQVVSGDCSAAFIFFGNSDTEIDIEYLGDKPNSIFLSNWIDRQHKVTTEVHTGNLANGFHKYDIVWTANSVQWFLDGKLICTHTKYVPTKPATIRLNHWGTNNLGWGGMATPNVNRYFYVKQATFTPLAAQ
jgi:endo-1,3-1,4-beta-glycanase ExoK